MCTIWTGNERRMTWSTDGGLGGYSDGELRDELARRRKRGRGELTPWGYDQLRKRTERKCLHMACSECHGTGRKKNGQMCVHMISCPCSRCTPYFC